MRRATPTVNANSSEYFSVSTGDCDQKIETIANSGMIKINARGAMTSPSCGSRSAKYASPITEIATAPAVPSVQANSINEMSANAKKASESKVNHGRRGG